MSKPIILGLTGTIGSGKGTVHKCFEAAGINYVYTSLSDRLREELDRRNIPKTRQTLVDLGNELRSQYGDHILAQRTVDILKGKQQILS